MKKFTKGTLQIHCDKNDLIDFDNAIRAKAERAIEECDSLGIGVIIGTSEEEDCLLAQFRINGDTRQQCNQNLRQMKSILKDCFNCKIEELFIGSGDKLF